MALNTSGTMSLAGTIVGESIEIELGGTGTSTISLNDSAVRTLLEVSTGQISISDAYSKSVASFSWDTSTSSPAASYNRNPPIVTSIHTGMKRCVMNDSGVVQYYLNATDSTLKANGTAADLTGGDGQVMVEIPKFYTRRIVSGNIITWSISSIPQTGFTLHPAFIKDNVEVNYRYYSAYDACTFDVSTSTYVSGQNYGNNSGANGVGVDVTAGTGDKLASVSGVYSACGLTRAEFRTLAANRGTGWRQLDFTLLNAVQLLYVIENQTFFAQDVTGAGNTGTTYSLTENDQSGNGGSIAGKSNGLGNTSTNTTTGASSATRAVAYMSYRGIENLYGNQWNWADGVIVNPDGVVAANSASWWYTNNQSDFSDTDKTGMTQITGVASTVSGYMTALADVNNFFIGTNTSGGSSSTYITDVYFSTTNLDRVVGVSGGADGGAASGDAGVFVISNTRDSVNRSRAFSARLCY